MKRNISAILGTIILSLVSTLALAQAWFPEGSEPKSGDTERRSSQKINYLLYAAAPSSLDYFPEGTEPQPGDTQRRSLQKINALLYNDLELGGGQLGGSGSAPVGTIINVNPGSALAGEVFVGIGTSGTNALTASRTTNTTVLVQSTAGDGTNAFRVNAATTHASGNLVEVQNNSTNVMQVSSSAGIGLGRDLQSFGTLAAGDAYIASYFNNLDGATTFRTHLGADDSDDFNFGSWLRQKIVNTDEDNVYAQIESSTYGGGTAANISIVAGRLNDAKYAFFNLGNLAVLYPTIDDGSTPYSLNTSITHSSGNLFEAQNNATNYVQIPADQAATNAPLILNINGTQKRVHIGAPDSGGTGLRALTIEN